MANKPGEHKTFQARILTYAEEIGWSYVLRPKSCTGLTTRRIHPPRRRRKHRPTSRPARRAYSEGPGVLIGELRHLHSDIGGNRDFLAYLRNARTLYDSEAGRGPN
jgi:type I restriction enzyme R subunit